MLQDDPGFDLGDPLGDYGEGEVSLLLLPSIVELTSSDPGILDGSLS